MSIKIPNIGVVGSVAALLLLAGATGTASAYINGDPLTITATTAGGQSASMTLILTDGIWSDNYEDWHFDSGANQTWSMYSDAAHTNLVATITDLHLHMYGDPQVVLNFAVQAGAATTTFNINSALLGFAPLTNPTAQASAAVTLTDNNFDGAALGGLLSAGAAYGADYNGLVPTGTPYARFINGLNAPAFGSNGAAGNVGPNTIGGAVADMSSKFSFTLSPFDSASGTSNYEIVPTPATLALMGMGGLVGLRRRR